MINPQISWVFDCKGAGLKNMDIDIINWNTEVQNFSIVSTKWEMRKIKTKK